MQQHVFRNVRDIVCDDATQNPPISTQVATDANGNWTSQIAFAPLGVSYSTFTTNGTVVSVGTGLLSPRLPWLYNTSRNFERYRVTRAVLIFVGNVGSTSVGRLIMDSTTDYADAGTGVTIGTSAGGKVFDLASSASKELRFNMDVDTTWKKVSSYTALKPGGANTLLQINSANDLLFSVGVLGVIGGPASVPQAGNFCIEYDVEFRDPITWTANA